MPVVQNACLIAAGLKIPSGPMDSGSIKKVLNHLIAMRVLSQVESDIH